MNTESAQRRPSMLLAHGLSNETYQICPLSLTGTIQGQEQTRLCQGPPNCGVLRIL